VGSAKRGKHVLVREHIICKDISKGKEATPIVAVNEVGIQCATKCTSGCTMQQCCCCTCSCCNIAVRN
jgi:hypothetical protein